MITLVKTPFTFSMIERLVFQDHVNYVSMHAVYLLYYNGITAKESLYLMPDIFSFHQF